MVLHDLCLHNTMDTWAVAMAGLCEHAMCGVYVSVV
jgi:hypothetical protein